MPGDVVFIIGGVLPLLYICIQGIRWLPSREATQQPESILFTEVVAQPEQR